MAGYPPCRSPPILSPRERCDGDFGLADAVRIGDASAGALLALPAGVRARLHPFGAPGQIRSRDPRDRASRRRRPSVLDTHRLGRGAVDARVHDVRRAPAGHAAASGLERRGVPGPLDAGLGRTAVVGRGASADGVGRSAFAPPVSVAGAREVRGPDAANDTGAQVEVDGAGKPLTLSSPPPRPAPRRSRRPARATRWDRPAPGA